jgi:hypothetical protein
MACASMQMLQMLALTIAPLGQPNPGAQLYHFVGNMTEPPAYGNCHPHHITDHHVPEPWLTTGTQPDPLVADVGQLIPRRVALLRELQGREWTDDVNQQGVGARRAFGEKVWLLR